MKIESGTLTTTIENLDVTVKFCHYPAYRGQRDSLGGVRGAGPPLEPDTDAEIEIEDVMHGEFSIIELLNDHALETLEERIWEGIRERQ